MLSKVVDALFGCLHTKYSFPITTKPNRNSKGIPSKPRTYVVCLAMWQGPPLRLGPNEGCLRGQESRLI